MIALLIPIGISLVISTLVSIVVIHIYRLRKIHKHTGVEYVDLDTFNELEKRVRALEKNTQDRNDGLVNDGIVETQNNSDPEIDSKDLSQEEKKSKKELKIEKYGPKKKKRIEKAVLSEITVPLKPDDVSYIFLKAADRKLVESDVSSSYYRAWIYENVLYYEFHCDRTRIQKAINNRSVLVEPFSVKDGSSIEVDESTDILTTKPGRLDPESYEIIEKAIIKYVKNENRI